MIETIIIAVMFGILLATACTMYCKDYDEEDAKQIGIDWGRQK